MRKIILSIIMLVIICGIAYSNESNVGRSDISFLVAGNFQFGINDIKSFSDTSDIFQSVPLHRKLVSAGAGLMVGSGLSLIGGIVLFAVGYYKKGIPESFLSGTVFYYIGIAFMSVAGLLFLIGLPILIVGAVLWNKSKKSETAFKLFIDSDKSTGDLCLGYSRKL